MSLDEIWADDLLSRRTEALFLERFLVRTYKQKAMLKAGEAYTIAVDASYGEGKSFFLRRLSRQLALNYPTAFIDAWADDTSDQPYTALTCALEETLDPYLDKPGAVGKAWQGVKDQGRSIARIASFGLVKRGLGLLITQRAADELGDLVGGDAEDRKDDAAAVSDILDRVTDLFAQKEAEAFRLRRESVAAFKANLEKLVRRLQDPKITVNPPVFIIVDELDRCRPTYAVKLLEEVKTLFDIRGLVFIFGTHGEALQHSVKALYGAQFDGAAYLRRFFRRRYALKRPELEELLNDWLKDTAIASAPLIIPPLATEGGTASMTFARFLAEMLRAAEVSPREGHAVLDLLDNFALMWGNRGPIHAGYVTPLAINWVMGRVVSAELNIGGPRFRDPRSGLSFGVNDLFMALFSAGEERLGRYAEASSSDTGVRNYIQIEMAAELHRRQGEANAAALSPLHRDYPSLIAEVGRFGPEDKTSA